MASDIQRYIRNIVSLEHDKAALRGTRQAFEALRQDMRDQVADAKKVDLAAQGAASGFNTMGKAAQTAQSRLASLKGIAADSTKEFTKLRQEVVEAGKAANDLPDDASPKKLRAAGGVGAVANLAGRIGGADASAPIQAIQSITQVSQELPQLGEAIAGLGPVGLAATAVIVGVTVGVAALNKILEGSKTALDNATDANQKYYELLGSGASSDDAQAQAETLQKTLENQKAELDTITNSFDKGFEDAQKTYGDAGARFLTLLGQVSNADDKLTGRADDLRKSIQQNSDDLARLQSGIEADGFAANDAAIAEEKLTKARQDAIPKLEVLADQASSLLQKNGEQTNEITSERLIRDLREQEDYNNQKEAQQKALTANLEKIDADGQSRLEAIRIQGNKRLEQIDAQLGKLGGQRNGINQKYMESERKAFVKFHEEQKKEDARANKERLRLLQSINSDLLDAEEANDVIAFIQAKRRGEEQLKQQAEDASAAKDERLAQFLEERQAADDAHKEELARIDEQIQAQQDAKVAAIQEIKDQKDAELARIKDAKDAAQAAFDEQQKLNDDARDLRLKRQDEDDARADLKRQNALQRALQDIDTKTQKEAAAIGIVGTSLNNLISAVQAGATAAIARIVSAAAVSSAGYGSTSSTSSSSSSSSSRNSGGKKAYGLGGIVTKPTKAILGERPGYGDLVLAYEKSKGPGSALQQYSNQPAIIQIYATVGDVASMSQVHEVATIIARKAATAVNKGLMNSQKAS